MIHYPPPRRSAHHSMREEPSPRPRPPTLTSVDHRRPRHSWRGRGRGRGRSHSRGHAMASPEQPQPGLLARLHQAVFPPPAAAPPVHHQQSRPISTRRGLRVVRDRGPTPPPPFATPTPTPLPQPSAPALAQGPARNWRGHRLGRGVLPPPTQEQPAVGLLERLRLAVFPPPPPPPRAARGAIFRGRGRGQQRQTPAADSRMTGARARPAAVPQVITPLAQVDQAAAAAVARIAGNKFTAWNGHLMSPELQHFQRICNHVLTTCPGCVRAYRRLQVMFERSVAAMWPQSLLPRVRHHARHGPDVGQLLLPDVGVFAWVTRGAAKHLVLDLRPLECFDAVLGASDYWCAWIKAIADLLLFLTQPCAATMGVYRADFALSAAAFVTQHQCD